MLKVCLRKNWSFYSITYSKDSATGPTDAARISYEGDLRETQNLANNWSHKKIYLFENLSRKEILIDNKTFQAWQSNQQDNITYCFLFPFVRVLCPFEQYLPPLLFVHQPKAHYQQLMYCPHYLQIVAFLQHCLPNCWFLQEVLLLIDQHRRTNFWILWLRLLRWGNSDQNKLHSKERQPKSFK